MTRVAIVFDQYGNLNQPFLTEWYNRIRYSNRLRVAGFSDRTSVSAEEGVTVFKTSGASKARRYLIWRIKSLISSKIRDVPFVFECLLSFRPGVVHLLNAQQFSLYRKSLDNMNAMLVVSFRGYETTVRAMTDHAWKSELLSLYNMADKLHFVSEYLKAQAVALGAPAEKCVVIRRSVDTSFFHPVKERKVATSMELLAVGRLTWQKGYEYLLNAIAKLKADGHAVKLRIVGTGNERDSLIACRNSLNLEGTVEFVGHLNRAELLHAFQSSDVFVQASVSDALPNSILEASACGLPIVSTTAGGIPEAVINGVTGILVKPGDADELAFALSRMLSDHSGRRTMGQNARQFVETEFSTIYETGRWENLYLEVGGQRGSRS